MAGSAAVEVATTGDSAKVGRRGRRKWGCTGGENRGRRPSALTPVRRNVCLELLVVILGSVTRRRVLGRRVGTRGGLRRDATLARLGLAIERVAVNAAVIGFCEIGFSATIRFRAVVRHERVLR